MSTSDVPGLLVALPGLQDGYFEKSVVLLCNYDAQGAFGLVVNQPASAQVREILADESLHENPAFACPLMIGGPVQQGEMFWAVHSSDYENEATTAISAQLRLSSAQDVIRALAEEHGPSRYLLGCGYSGWGAEQLDREIQEETWWLSPLDAELVMGLEHEQRWEQALTSIGIDPFTASFVKAGTV